MLKPFALCAALICIASAAEAGGIDCNKANSAIDKTICGSVELRSEDAVLSRLYETARRGAFDTGESSQPEAQAEWLRTRNACLNKSGKADEQCLLLAYATRNAELAMSTLDRNPEVAASTLRKHLKEAAPLLEALSLYATEPATADWTSHGLTEKRQAITQLLQPAFDKLKGLEKNSTFAQQILADEKLTSVTEVLASPEKFSEFMGLKSVDVDTNPTDLRLKASCSILLKRPDLVAMTGSYFGSTIDNFVIDQDCKTALPALPKLDALQKEIREGWPQCEGTIRFAAYRNHAQSLTEALVADEARIRAAPSSSAITEHELTSVNEKTIAQAVEELSEFYMKYRKVPLANAQAAARQYLDRFLDTAQQCE